MSKPKSLAPLTIALRVVFLLLMAAILIAAGLFLLLFFVPVVGWYVWRLLDRTAELERKVAALEGHPEPEQGKS